MSYYTTIAKNVRCPFLEDRVIITGKYQINAYTDNASFLYATCSSLKIVNYHPMSRTNL